MHLVQEQPEQVFFPVPECSASDEILKGLSGQEIPYVSQQDSGFSRLGSGIAKTMLV